LLWLMTMNPW